MEKLVKISPFIALAALVCGLIGLVLGLMAYQSTQKLDGRFGEVSSYGQSIQALSEQVEKLSKTKYTTKQEMKDFASDIQGAFDQISGEIAKVRSQSRSDSINLSEMQAQIEELQSSVRSPQTSSMMSPVMIPESSEEQITTADGEIAYKIKSGDTLGKIAKEFGVSLDEIFNANPGIEPRRLRLGQQIIIPVKGE